ncbi:MAG: hypothetical protein KTR31_08850 [Myxococcales bacterium]|nr:hypothetical protein [Myxococcales bacterium]
MTALVLLTTALSWAVDLEVPDEQNPLAWARAWSEVVTSLRDDSLMASRIAWTRDGTTWTLTLEHEGERARVVGLNPARSHSGRVEQLYVAVALLGPSPDATDGLAGLLAAPPPPPRRAASVPATDDPLPIPISTDLEPLPQLAPAPPSSPPPPLRDPFRTPTRPRNVMLRIGSWVGVVDAGTDSSGAPMVAVEGLRRWVALGVGARVAVSRDADVTPRSGQIGVTARVTDTRVESSVHAEVRAPLQSALQPFASVGLGAGWRSLGVAGTTAARGWVPTSVVRVGLETRNTTVGIRPSVSWTHDFRSLELNLGGRQAQMRLDRFQVGVGVRLGGRR